MSGIVEKLLEEEREAEKLMYGSEENPSEPEAPSTEDDKVESAPEEESTEETESTGEKPKRTNWKKRFIGYKTATDETIKDLRVKLDSREFKIANLEAQIQALSNQIEELKTGLPPEDPFKDVFTQEDKDLLGEEAIEAMKKAALATKPEEPKVSPEIAQLKAEVEEWKRREAEREKAEQEKAQADNTERLRMKLLELVPNFEEIDSDDDFGVWLNDIDEFSDQVRFVLFQNAVQSGDVAYVAKFYQDYAKSKGSKESFIEDYITPEGDGATQDSPERTAKRKYHISEYVEFMDDVTKGRYKGREKEAQKLELMYDKAMVEGRIYE
jgi:hypothetical protein